MSRIHRASSLEARCGWRWARVAFVATACAALAAPAAPLFAQGKSWHVSPAGSDANAGSATQPFRTVQKGVQAARRGDTVLVHAGTYDGVVEISRASGAPGNPITLRGAGDGPSILTARHPPESCSRTDPAKNRTLLVVDGTDHWTVRDLVIQGGVFISGTEIHTLDANLRNRTLPGRGGYDPVAAQGTLERMGSDGADHVELLDNVISGRGILIAAARHGRIEGNEIRDIECGTGGGIWLKRYSDGWEIRDNHVYDVAGSAEHYMSEGIRHGSSSMYNTVEDNLVEDLSGRGRGITTDVNSGWNVIRRNVVRRTEQGYSEQVGSWGNQWIENVSEDNRRFGFAVYNQGTGVASPNDDIPAFLEFRCNRSVGDPVAFNSGGIQRSSFAGNDFPVVQLGDFVREYWERAGNTWEGARIAPEATPPSRFEEVCAGAGRRIWGDGNRDGLVDVTDVTDVLYTVTGLPLSPFDVELADVDADGSITTRDAQLLLGFLAGRSGAQRPIGQPAP